MTSPAQARRQSASTSAALVVGTDGVDELPEEEAATAAEHGDELGLERIERRLGGGGRVSSAVSARWRLIQPSSPASDPDPAQSTSPEAVSSSSIAGR